ncbi:hypothetical protein Tco_1043779 [Tanacetum coccineum]|uniref:Uncharacterized protein n=1 Tax=Tanacetum coccineum TaxID=301880 RepID=A0ABQ5GP09_9ASTR
MAAAVPQTLEYRGGQLNVAPVLEVKIFTNWKKRKSEELWTPDERKAANLDQHLKSLIMSVIPDDQMNFVINCLTSKSTWDDMILYNESPFDVKESRVMDLKLCYNTFKFKECENLTQTFTRYKSFINELVNDGINLSKLEINTGLLNGLVAEICEWDAKEVSYDEEEMVEVKSLMALIEEDKVSLSKEDARNGKWIQISMEKCISEQTPSQKRGLEVEASSASGQEGNALIESSSENSVMPQQNNERTLPSEPKINTTNPSVVVLDSSASDYDYADDSKAFSYAKVNNRASTSKSAQADKLKNVKFDDDLPFATLVPKERNDLKSQIYKAQSSGSRTNKNQQVLSSLDVNFVDNTITSLKIATKFYSV